MIFPASFKLSLILHFVAAATLPMLLLGVLGYQYFEKRHIETVGGLIDNHALAVSQSASELLEDTTVTLDLISRTLDSGMLRPDDEVNRYLQLAVERLPAFESILLLDKRKRVTHLGLSVHEGVSREDFLGLDLSAHDVFSQDSPGAENTWSNTFLSSITAEPSITLSLPIADGFLLGTVSLQKLSRQFKERLDWVGRNFQFSLLDHHGVLIADSRIDLVPQRLNLRIHPEVREALDNQLEVESKWHEDRTLMESVRLVPETGWVAYVSLPVAEVMQGFKALRSIIFTALALTAGMGILLSLWLSRRVLSPVLLLRDATAKVAMGDYAQILQPAVYVELEELSQSFRDMRSAVDEREQSLRNNQERYRELVNSIDGIVWELELDEFRFTFVSEQAAQILGYPVQQWLEVQNFWQDHVYEEDRGWVLEFCATETAALRDHDFEYRMLAADGSVVWLKEVVSVVVAQGRPERLRGVMLDITRRKKAELVLRETANRLELLINHMPDGCILWDARNRVEFWNPAAEKIFGFALEEVFGQNFSALLAAQDKQKAMEIPWQEHTAHDAMIQSVIEHLTKDGRTITCEWHSKPLHDVSKGFGGGISIVRDISARVKAEQALKESEARFRTIFQTNPDAVTISRLSDGKMLVVNKNVLTLSGFTEEELLSKSTLELGLWQDPQEWDTFLSLLISSGVVDNQEITFCTKSGINRIGLTSACRLRLNDEDCILTVIRDITEMKEAELRMARSEFRFRSLVAVMGEGLIILGYNGEVVQCNQSAERILKMSADEMIGKLYSDLIPEAFSEEESLLPPDQHPVVLTLNDNAPVFNKIMGIPQRDGQMTWLQVNTHALGLDKSGHPVAVVVSFADVTRLKRIEAELRSNENNLQTLSQQFKGVLEAIPDQIMVLDPQMRMLWLNRQLDSGLSGQVEWAGVCCAQIADVLCSPLATETKPPCDSCPIKRAFVSRRPEEGQWGADNGLQLSLRAFPIFNADGDVVNVIGIVQDITESVRQQTQVMRTGQLAALGELAAGVAHEINNPINGVINYAQLILNKAVADSREQELSQRIIREGERIATIVRELLHFAREESQEVKKVQVAEALDEALALVQNQLKKDGIRLQVNFPENLPRVASRSHQIQQLFLNLISNARYALVEKYPDDDDDKLLRIQATEIVEEDHSRVRISFLDHGCGIEKELLPRVLNPFVTTKAAGEGTGLGLSISHEIVRKHRGTISIESVHGEFTEVIVELPAEI